MNSKSKVYFFFEKKYPGLKNRTQLKNFIESIFKKEKKKLVLLNYVFCSDRKLLEINQQFLSHSYYTDIITFDLSNTKSIQAEIYISIDRVKYNALKLRIAATIEFHRVIFHGALHLCGYDDKEATRKKEMRKREDFYLKLYFK